MITSNVSDLQVPAKSWSAEKANDWYQQKGWLVGCNYTPSTAVNQLEMWDADTFDPEMIDRELSWADRIASALWFHDIFRSDGTPCRADEVDFFAKTLHFQGEG